MLCNCCLRNVEHINKLEGLKESYENLFNKRDENDDTKLCDWCIRMLQKINKFRIKALKIQEIHNSHMVNNCLPNIYEFQIKLSVDQYDEIFIEEDINDNKTKKNYEDINESDGNRLFLNLKRNSIEQFLVNEELNKEIRSEDESEKKCDNYEENMSEQVNFFETIILKSGISTKSKKQTKKKSIIKIKNLDRSQELILHSYIISPNHLVSKIRASKKYEINFLTDDEILNGIKLKDEKLKNDLIKYKCLLCHESFNDEQQQNEHTKLHQFKSNSVLCKFCNIWIVDNLNSIITHYRNHYIHFKCSKCSETYKSIRELSLHYERKHNSYTCPHCCTFFNTRSNMGRHIEKIHSNKSYQCDDCGKVYNTRDSLRSHIEIHGDKCYSCDICGKKFKTNSNYQAHKSIMHKSLPIKCSLCNKVFRYKNLYKKHLEDVCNQVERRKYKCSQCDNIYLSFDRMERHVNFVHMGIGLVCSICGKLFQNKSTLNKHMEIHGDRSCRSRDHICDLCGKAFYTKREMKEHMKIHSDDRPLKCKLCNATFKFKAALYTHTNLVHKNIKRKLK